MWMGKEHILRELERIIPEDGCNFKTDIDTNSSMVMTSDSALPKRLVRNDVLILTLSMKLEASGLKVIK